MAIKTFEIEDGSPQHQFLLCRDDIAGFTGGYGNGKTAALCVEAIQIASEYDHARVLVARATKPKLEDSTKPELIKWLPEDWVESWPAERRNNILLAGTKSTIEFRHVRQEGKGKGEEQSNLLSATYDAIFIDQIDDPEFGFKDFADLVGRLRGTAKYIGDDPTMPRVGPQWLRFAANPTRNWLFREVVNPYFVYVKTGIITQKLIRDVDTNKPLLKVFNAPTSSNKKNTGEKYGKRMQAVFRGTMAKRYIDGDWSAYEGLVYPDFDETVHVVEQKELNAFIKQGIIENTLGVSEAYDYGQVVPSCYGLSFHDRIGNVFLVDGFYQSHMLVPDQAKAIFDIRNKWGITPTDRIYADPDIFRGHHASSKNVGEAIEQMFRAEGIEMQRASNDIQGGIEKVSSYLAVDDMHFHPIKKVYGSPRFFVGSDLEWFQNEIVDYYWNKNVLGQNVDKPRNVNDHAMDMLKYNFTRRNKVVGQILKVKAALFDKINNMGWTAAPDSAREELRPRHR
jgi:hypothetical protein